METAFKQVTIGEWVWIGGNAIILPGVTLGDHVVIGAGSVVRGKFPANSVLIGNPVQIVSGIKTQLLFSRNCPGYLKTNNLSLDQTIKLLKESFEIE